MSTVDVEIYVYTCSRGKSYIDFRLRMLKYNNNPSSKHVLVYLVPRIAKTTQQNDDDATKKPYNIIF